MISCNFKLSCWLGTERHIPGRGVDMRHDSVRGLPSVAGSHEPGDARRVPRVLPALRLRGARALHVLRRPPAAALSRHYDVLSHEVRYLKYFYKAVGRWAAGSSPSDQDWARVDGSLCSTRASRSCQHSQKGLGIGPNVCRGRGTRSNETLRTPALGQFKEHTGFLVSRSLKLPAAPTWAAGVILWFSLYPKKGVRVNHPVTSLAHVSPPPSQASLLRRRRWLPMPLRPQCFGPEPGARGRNCRYLKY